jgi:type II secretory pathway component PulF
MTNTTKKPIHHRIAGHAVRVGQSVLVIPVTVIAVVAKHASPVGDFFGRIGKALSDFQERVELSSAPSLSVKEQAFFVKRLSFLIKASVPILESLDMVSKQVTSRGYARVIQSVMKDVANGMSLAKSLGKFPKIFGDFGINIIKVGESSGTLSQNLDYLADELKKRQNLKQKVMGAFVYPAVITVATLGITGFLVLYLFPKIMPIFSSLNMELPMTTKIVIAVSTFLQTSGLWLILGIIIFFALFAFALKKSKSFHFLFDGWVLRAPVLGQMMRFYNLANATRTLGLLLKSGLTLAEALPLTADTTQNLVYKSEYRKLGESVQRGERISAYLAKSPDYFPAIMTQMIAVGERSGSLSNTLVYMSDLYEAEVDDFTKNLSSLIEPAMMVIMGVIVGFVAISIITPIYGITQNLHP